MTGASTDPIFPEPAAATGRHPDTLHAVAITRPALHGRLALAWQAGGVLSPAARVFLARAREAFPA